MQGNQSKSYTNKAILANYVEQPWKKNTPNKNRICSKFDEIWAIKEKNKKKKNTNVFYEFQC